MNKRLRLRFPLATFILILASSPGIALAVEEHLVTPDRLVADDISFNPGEPVVGFFHAGRSYECRLAQATKGTGNDYLYFSPTIQGPTQNIQGTGVGGLYPAEATSPSTAARQAFRRISFIPQETGVHKLSVVFDNSLAVDASADCFDTTLVGSFNTFLAQRPIVELRNRGNTTVSATVTALNLQGEVIETQTLSVLASSRSDAILSQVPSQLYGSIVVTYLGPQGLISADVAEYDYINGVPNLRRQRPTRSATLVP